MLIEEIYNHKHKLANTILVIRAAFIIPAFILVLISSSTMFNLSVFAVLVVQTNRITRVPVKDLVKLFKIPLLFLVFGCITIALSFQSSSPVIHINRISIGIDKVNIELAKLVFSRSLAILSLVYFYLLTHTISEIAELMHSCKVPKLFIELFVLSYKFIFNLISAGKSMLIAQNCRLAYSHNGNNISAFTLLIASVFRKAISQTTQVEIALAARLGSSDFIFVSPQRGFHKRQVIAPLFLSLFLFVLFLILQHYD